MTSGQALGCLILTLALCLQFYLGYQAGRAGCAHHRQKTRRCVRCGRYRGGVVHYCTPRRSVTRKTVS